MGRTLILTFYLHPKAQEDLDVSPGAKKHWIMLII